MQRTFFTREEARNKIGHMVEALSDFPSVPKGSQGKVVRAQRLANNQWLACVEWNLPRAGRHYEMMFGDVGFNIFGKNKPVTDQFCKSEYEILLKTPASGE
ncbi:MAG: hypothetical protein JMDDDDMK_03480 [Acidobacteria bacterium]|nr:hypothetical protein [Acidobacteriota bacterium]